MKIIIIIIFFTLITAQVFALNSTSTIEEVKEDARYSFAMPKYLLNGKTYVSADAVCIYGNEIRSNKKYNRCITWKTVEPEEPWECAVEEDIYLTAEISGIHFKTVNSRELKKVPFKLPTEFKIKVYSTQDLRFKFPITYKVPDCVD